MTLQLFLFQITYFSSCLLPWAGPNFLKMFCVYQIQNKLVIVKKGENLSIFLQIQFSLTVRQHACTVFDPSANYQPKWALISFG